ncbi:MAG: hypothetical protein ACRDNH_02405 [Gaiellaceae bacterium]
MLRVLCRSLPSARREAAPDYAQGAYHDNWFAVVGADGARLPARALPAPLGGRTR